MGERQRSDESVYTVKQVATLIGLREGWGNSGSRHVTVADLISQKSDPGGSAIWLKLAKSRQPRDAWMAERGPLQPDGTAACMLWDFLRAMKHLPLRTQAVVALKAFGFSQRDVAEALGISQSMVKKILWGQEDNSGAVVDLTRFMNGRGDD